jgi:hypothetical protein
MPEQETCLPSQERAAVREGAIFLFGDVIHYGGKKLRQSLKDVASQATVPLLFNMADPCQEVAMVSVLQLSWGNYESQAEGEQDLRAQLSQWSPE